MYAIAITEYYSSSVEWIKGFYLYRGEPVIMPSYKLGKNIIIFKNREEAEYLLQFISNELKKAHWKKGTRLLIAEIDSAMVNLS